LATNRPQLAPILINGGKKWGKADVLRPFENSFYARVNESGKRRKKP
jgi:hypothetical protein